MKHPQVIRKEKYIELIENFKNKNFSRNQIQHFLKWNSKQLTNFIYNHKIELSRYSNENITDKQKQIIIGSLLGDGWISYSGKYSKNARFGIQHSTKQLEYLKYKYSILKPLCTKKGIIVKTRKDKRRLWKDSETCYFKTKSLKIFTEYRNKWYKNKKIINKKDVYKINSLGLAIWYMDDGCFNPKSNSIVLYTQGFSKEDNIVLKQMLKDKFNINTILRKGNYLYIKKDSQQNFINLIKPYIINSMQYKIASNKKSGEFRETPEVDNPEPNSLNSIKVDEKVQRLTGEELTNKPDTSAGLPGITKEIITIWLPENGR